MDKRLLGINSRQWNVVVNPFLAGLAVLVLAFAGTVSAADTCPPTAVKPTPEMIQAGARNARDHGFLWRIVKDGHTSFLYGTIHVAKFEWMFPGPKVAQALQATDTIALELDMLDPDIQRRMTQGLSSRRNSELPSLLKKRLQNQAESECVPYATLAGLSPEMQITSLTLLAARREGLDASYAIDAVLAGIGHGSKKNVVSLETPEAQLEILHGETPQETTTFVREGLADLETGRARKSFVHIARVWADSAYDELANYQAWCDCMNTDNERESMRRLLDERNPNLARHIDELHREGKRVFAAVGSLHMFGPTGLPTLMAKKGYQVERIDFRN